MGLFVSIEGSDGSGKTTQLNLLEKNLRERGFQVVRSREPGGTRIGEKLRNIILDPANQEMDPRTEALLYAASRAQHIKEVIKPAVESGAIMVCDRFIESSLVYQGIGRGLGIDEIYKLNEWAIDGILPDLTLILYIDYEEGLKRKQLQNGCLDRLEMAGSEFHRKVNAGYLELAERFPERIVLINALRSIEEIQAELLEHICRKAQEKNL